MIDLHVRVEELAAAMGAAKNDLIGDEHDQLRKMDKKKSPATECGQAWLGGTRMVDASYVEMRMERLERCRDLEMPKAPTTKAAILAFRGRCGTFGVSIPTPPEHPQRNDSVARN